MINSTIISSGLYKKLRLAENLWVIDPIPLDYAIHLCNVDKFSLFSFSGRGFLGVLKATSKFFYVNTFSTYPLNGCEKN